MCPEWARLGDRHEQAGARSGAGAQAGRDAADARAGRLREGRRPCPAPRPMPSSSSVPCVETWWGLPLQCDGGHAGDARDAHGRDVRRCLARSPRRRRRSWLAAAPPAAGVPPALSRDRGQRSGSASRASRRDGCSGDEPRSLVGACARQDLRAPSRGTTLRPSRREPAVRPAAADVIGYGARKPRDGTEVALEPPPSSAAQPQRKPTRARRRRERARRQARRRARAG